MKITTAIFDLDGTLLNTLGDLCDSVTYAVEKHGFPPVSMEQTVSATACASWSSAAFPRRAARMR